MKWEIDQRPADMPNNVLTQQWLPQDDILAHPNIRLFISHCGLGGVGEAKYHGVPILGIPLFGDQPLNIKAVVNEKWGLHLPYNQITEATLTQTLNEMLTNRSYVENVKRISLLYRDRPQSGMDTAVFWIEYVLRHNGARHMQSEAIHLNFFQKNSLDVVGFLLVVGWIVWRIMKFLIIEVICRRRVCKSQMNKLKDN